MDDATTLLQRATQEIAALEAIAKSPDAGAIRAWAQKHFRALVELEKVLSKVGRALGTSEPPAAPAAASLLIESLAAVTAAEKDDSINVSLGALLTLTGAQRGFVALHEPDGSLSFPAARAFGALDVTSPEAQVSRSILDVALRAEGAFVVPDAATDARFGHQRSVQALGLRAVLVVPLFAQKKAFGVLYLDNPTRAGAFDDAARATAEDFARLVAPILARDLALATAQRRSDLRLETLRERFKLDRIVGQSRAMGELLALVAKVAPRDTTVLITGETGTGKELVAEALHANSHRAAEPFVAVNCGALPSELVESELFGHERGAFTGATATRIGRFEAADGGTLFLDEIGEMPLAAQVKLLRVLESGVFDRIGGAKPRRCDVRVIAATNRNLSAEIVAGRFRQDLLFRLKVIELALPPLREREGDIALLTGSFVDRFARAHGTPPPRLDPAVMGALEGWRWPGNVRELKNVLERAVVLSDGAISLDLLPPEIAGGATATPSENLKAAVRAFKRRFVQRAISDADGDHAAAAARLGVHPKYIYQLVRDLDEDE
jgi:transcriptional regulator with GAF, ATPase, and Fis domain